MRIRERFNPRAPCGARPRAIPTRPAPFQPTRPLRGATDCAVFAACTYLISTHAPLAGRDADHVAVHLDLRISTHAPLAGRDAAVDDFTLPSIEFQPTRPLRGATPRPRHGCAGSMLFQPTRPLRGATSSPWPQRARTERFQPTRPLRGATISVIINTFLHLNFNPRAPCGARRQLAVDQRETERNFNPRAPCGARQRMPASIARTGRFQPTRPLRGATAAAGWAGGGVMISTHAPLAGRDPSPSP